MQYLTILYLYANINTHCCIANCVKKGMALVLDVWELHLHVLWCYQPWRTRWVLWAGTVLCCCWHRQALGSLTLGLIHKGTKWFLLCAFPWSFWNKTWPQVTASTLFFSLQETCLIWVLKKEWKLQVGFPAAGAQSNRVSGWWMVYAFHRHLLYCLSPPLSCLLSQQKHRNILIPTCVECH